MEVRSPADGIVYHGKCVRGRWSDSGAMAEKLLPGGSVNPGEVFITIVDPAALRVRLNVPEKELHRLEPGIEGTVSPTGFPDLDVAATIDTISGVPVSQGVFDGAAALRGECPGRIVAGMTCSAKFTAYARKDALVAPAAAVHEDEEHEGAHVVWVKKADGGHERRAVKVGKRTEDKVEILDGVAEAEELLLQKPER
jgi:multidrug efflux pump subunit AcrA (membrane-fusion protein)